MTAPSAPLRLAPSARVFVKACVPNRAHRALAALEQRLGDDLTEKDIARCRCGCRLRPHICWFGEIPFDMDRIGGDLARATVFLTVGTSGAVYPAAAFVHTARGRGARTIYVGPEAPDNASAFDELRLGKAGDLLPGMLAAETA